MFSDKSSPFLAPSLSWSWQWRVYSPGTPSSRSRWLYSVGTLEWRWRPCLPAHGALLHAYSVQYRKSHMMMMMSVIMYEPPNSKIKYSEIFTKPCTGIRHHDAMLFLITVYHYSLSVMHNCWHTCILCIAKQTHSDVVGIDVVWTKNVWICFRNFNPSCVNWKHKVKLIKAQQNVYSFLRAHMKVAFFSNLKSNWSSHSAEVSTLSTCVMSFFPQEVGETGNGRLLCDSQGRIFLYLFLLLFSGFWPSFRGYSSLHSCCWSTW